MEAIEVVDVFRVVEIAEEVVDMCDVMELVVSGSGRHCADDFSDGRQERSIQVDIQ